MSHDIPKGRPVPPAATGHAESTAPGAFSPPPPSGSSIPPPPAGGLFAPPRLRPETSTQDTTPAGTERSVLDILEARVRETKRLLSDERRSHIALRHLSRVLRAQIVKVYGAEADALNRIPQDFPESATRYGGGDDR